MKKTPLLVAGLLLIGFFFGYLWAQPSLVARPQSAVVSEELGVNGGQITDDRRLASADQSASLMIDYGNGMVRVYPEIVVAPGQTMLETLQQLAATEELALETKNFGELGIMVEQIGSMTNGDDGKYWQYWVNNASIPYAASTYVVQPGDVIEWKFLNYK